MNKKLLIVIIIILVVAAGLTYSLLLSQIKESGKTEKVYRVGIIGGIEAFGDIANGFKAKMTELGYVEGKNIVYDVQVANFDAAGAERVVKKFVVDKVDLVFAFPTEAAVAAKVATQGTNVPVVFSIAGIEGGNLVESVRQPGGNITGVRYPGPDLVVKRFEFLLELAPKIKRLYIPYDPTYPSGPPALSALRPVAASKGVTLIETPVSSIEDIRAKLKARAELTDMGIDAVQIMPEALTQSPDGWLAIANFANEHKLPLVGSMLFSAENGGIFAYCIDFVEVGKLAAPIADKIFKGTPAGTISLVTPEAHLWLNYKRAQELGLTVPESMLSMADKIIR